EGPADPVVAADDTATTPEDVAVVIYVLANDPGEELEVTAVTQPTNGAVTITDDGATVTYTPDPGFVGTDTFSYTVTDGDGNTDTATVTVTVTEGPADPVVAADDTATTPEDVAVVIDDLPNDTGDELEVTAATQPTNGAVPTTDDGATVTVTVPEGPADPVVAADDTATAPEDVAVVIDVLANDTGEELEVTAVTQPTNGAVTITDDGATVTYTPDPGFVGTDTFSYTVTD